MTVGTGVFALASKSSRPSAHDTQEVPKTRTVWIDIAKGVGISLVVWGHVVRGIDASRLVANSSLLHTIDYAIYSFHMPLFFFIMGILFRTGGTLLDLWHRLSYLVYCYFLWSGVHIFLQILLRDYVNSPLEFHDFVMLPFTPIDQFWFLYALVICQVISFFASRTKVILVGVVVCVLVLHDWTRGMIYVALSYFPFMAFGILLSTPVLNWKPSIGTTALIIVGFAISAGATYSAFGCYFPCFSVVPASVLGVASVVSISKQLSLATHGLLVRLGRSSLSIFCLHVIFGSGCRIVVSSVFPEVPAIFQIVVGVIAGLFFPLLVHEWLERRNFLGYLGFSKFRRWTVE